jgi:hypothetical protein
LRTDLPQRRKRARRDRRECRRLYRPPVGRTRILVVDATDTTTFGTVALPASFGATSLEVGAGMVATLSENISLFAVADYTANITGPRRETIEGNLGIRVTW